MDFKDINKSYLKLFKNTLSHEEKYEILSDRCKGFDERFYALVRDVVDIEWYEYCAQIENEED